MTDRCELLEAALDSRPDGIALLGTGGEVVFWSQAAQGITGHLAMELIGRPLPKSLEPLLPAEGVRMETAASPGNKEDSHALVRVFHKLGNAVLVLARVVALRNDLGERIGAAIVFHSAENLDAPPHREEDENKDVEESRAEFEERLLTEFEDFEQGGAPFGVIWISVDQAEALLKTHGVAAHRTMIDKVQRTLARGLRPTEEMGRWDEDEFLILAHERNIELLGGRAQTLAGLTRTTDFRWWGDRISLTVSAGAAQAVSDSGGGPAETLAQLLERAGKAMENSSRNGGNRATAAVVHLPAKPTDEDSICSPS
jgi:PAS domain S-box-containing protein